MNKKRTLLIFVCLLGLAAAAFLPKPNAAAYSGTPYDTYTLGPRRYWIKTQTAFAAAAVYKPDIMGAEDMFYNEADGRVYVADTGNKRIAIFDAATFEALGEITDEVHLKKPTGIFIAHDKIYAADPESALVLIFDIHTGSLLQTIGRPTERIFGASETYAPTKLCADLGGNIYVTSDGSVNGLMQFNAGGALLGFTGVNQTPVSFMSALRNVFFSKSQREQLFKKTPPSPTFVTIGRNNLLYTVTNQAADGSVKKLNTGGSVIMTPSLNMENTICAAVSPDENLYTVGGEGMIAVFDSYGEVLFTFGPQFSNADISGVIRKPSAISLKHENFMVLDRELNLVVEYKPTDFAKLVFEAAAFYKDGRYVEGMASWNNVLLQNSQFILAYKALAKANMKLENYAVALSQFKLAEDKAGYSDAFWQVRNAFIQENLALLLLAGVLLTSVIVAVYQLNKRTRLFLPVRTFFGRVKRVKFVSDFGFIKTYLRHPINSAYRIKRRGSGSVAASTVLYLSIMLTQILGMFVASYLFEVSALGLWNIALYTLLPIVLFVGANYFVSTVSDGEGSLKNIYISTAYALSPLILAMLPLYLISNLLTYNESFIYTVLQGAILLYTAVMVIVNTKQIHNFSVKKTVVNLILTLLTIVLFVLFVFIIYMLIQQEFGVLSLLVQEVFG